jgi:hypothetical protein
MKSRHTAVVVVRLRMSQTSHYASSVPGTSAIPRVLTQSGSGVRIQSRFNSAGRHKRPLRGGSFHRVRQLPRARAQVPAPDSIERSLGWVHDRR